ncbi:MAG: sirohydrochlorin cobaltochelatase, partial [Anaerovoracaceae bacterium]|nr:sirohydrochlorin cobaltochelatase [Anaerovoracaceae bacterium]
VADIGGVEKALQEAYPDWSVRRAFTAQIIINHIQARDGEFIDNMDQALQRAVDNGVKNIVIQPTHLMHGAEYDELVSQAEAYKDKFESMIISEPLLGEVGSDATVINADKETVAKAAVAEAVKAAGADSLDALKADGTAIVFMGHGTSHTANVTYSQMQAQMQALGYDNVFIGTVEGKPESTALPEVKKAVEAAGYTKVILRPLMVVAGDHANNDMAADEEGTWYYGFVNGGEFEVEGADEAVDIGAGLGAENVSCQIEGLGRIADIQALYVAHVAAALQ